MVGYGLTTLWPQLSGCAVSRAVACRGDGPSVSDRGYRQMQNGNRYKNGGVPLGLVQSRTRTRSAGRECCACRGPSDHWFFAAPRNRPESHCHECMLAKDLWRAQIGGRHCARCAAGAGSVRIMLRRPASSSRPDERSPSVIQPSTNSATEIEKTRLLKFSTPRGRK